jgi:hypothetical protein
MPGNPVTNHGDAMKSVTGTLLPCDGDGSDFPESWNCVDCGCDTAPGVPNRSALRKAMARHGECEITYDDRCEVYMVRDFVWKKVGMGAWDGCICVGCLEKRLGRKLKPKDFPDHVFNTRLPGTRRLMQRQGRKADATG